MRDIRTFKNGLSNWYDNRCIISGYSTNEKNHIIPRSFAINKKKYLFLATDCNNGTCLTPTLHTEYDNYYWDFDVYNARLNPDGITCTVPIIISTMSNISSRDLMIMEYQGQWATINLNTLPYMWVHYQVFLSINYHQNYNAQMIHAEYLFWLESSYFQQICQKPILTLHQAANNLLNLVQDDPLLITKTRNFGSEYLVISRNHPFNMQLWFSNIDLDENLVNNYQSKYDP